MKSLRCKTALWLLLGLCGWFETAAQANAYARKQLDTLASEAFHGRGYVQGGQQLAADYLLREFQRLGLQPLSDNYLQTFPLLVNSFDSVLLRVNGRALQPGHDYLVHPYSGHGEGQKLRPRKQVLLLQAQQSLPQNLRPVQLLLDTGISKLTWSVGTDQQPWPRFQIRQNVLPKRIKTIDFVARGSFREQRLGNVVGFLPGTSHPDTIVIVCAHYDHLGRMGSTLFAGANDNASGTALLLDLARHYAQPQNRPAHSLLFIAFAAEEAGLVGSRHYVQQPLWPLAKTKMVVNLDLMGGGSEGLMVVNAPAHPATFAALDSLNAVHQLLPKLQQRANAANSDHFPFTQKGVPALFFYTLGDVKAYHDPNDQPEDLAWQHYEAVFKLIEAFVALQANPHPHD